MKQFPEIIGCKEVAELLGVSRQYAKRLAMEKKIRNRKIAAGFIFLADDVREYKKSRAKKSKSDKRIKMKDKSASLK